MEITNDAIKLNLQCARENHEAGWTSIHKIDLGSTSSFDLGNEGFFDEDKHFIDCCLNRTVPAVSWQDGVDVQRIIEAVYRSSEANSAVDLESID